MIDRERVKELYRQGKKGTHIAAALSCSPTTIWKIHRELQRAGELDPEGDGQTTPGVEQPPRKFQTGGAPGVTGLGTGPFVPLAKDPDILRQEKENELLRLRAERERLQRELQAQPAQSVPPGSGEIGILRVEIMGELRELRRDREPLMTAIRDVQRDLAGVLEKVGQTKEIDLSALQAAVGNNGDSLETTIPLVKKIIELGKELGGGSSGDDDQTSIEKLGTTILSGIFSGRQQTPGLPSSARTGSPQVDPMQARIWSFISSIEREAGALTDPWTIAEILEKELNVCPEPFRALILNNPPNAILAGLARFVPQQVHARITGLMQQNPQARQWLDAFIEGLQGEEVTQAEFEEQPAGVTPPPTPQHAASGEPHHVGTGWTEEDLFGDSEETFPTRHPGGGTAAQGA